MKKLSIFSGIALILALASGAAYGQSFQFDIGCDGNLEGTDCEFTLSTSETVCIDLYLNWPLSTNVKGTGFYFYWDDKMSVVSESNYIPPWDTSSCLPDDLFYDCTVSSLAGLPGPQLILKDFVLQCDAEGDTTIKVEGCVLDMLATFHYPDPVSCTIHQGEGEIETICDDGIDNDGDDAIDCDDSDCNGKACNDDNTCTDGDTCVDGQCVGECKATNPDDPCCDDPACEGAPACMSTEETICDDGIDNDGDQAIDCDDSDCDGKACNDDNSCTDGDTCIDKSCVGTPKDCNDDNDCTDDSCVNAQCINECNATGPDDPCCDNPACADAPSCRECRVTLEVEDITAHQGEASIQVPVSMENQSDEVLAIETLLLDDNNCLTCTGCTPDPDRASDFMCFAYERLFGGCKVIMVNLSSDGLPSIAKGDGTVFTVDYTSNCDADDCDGCITLAPVEEDTIIADVCEDPVVPVCVKSGEICFITCGDVYPPGDDCGDGSINIFDILEEIDIVLGIIVPTECQVEQGDVPTGNPTCKDCSPPDGVINIFDILVIIDKALDKDNCCDYYYFGEI